MNIPSINNTEAYVLRALSKERYGLEIIEKVKQISDGKVKLTIGGVYTTLRRMEEKGLLESRWGDSTAVRQGARRRYYKCTGLGIRALKEAQTILKPILDHVFNPVCWGAV